MIASVAANGVRTIAIDRPDRRNALSSEGLDRLHSSVDSATEAVVVLRGAGEAFCAGADLDEVAALADAEAARAFARRGQAVARALASYDGAVVAAVDGPARGGGVELALACDVRVCTERSTFGEPGVGLGLFGAWGGTARLPAIVGRGVAMDLALSGRAIDAVEARRVGLVSRIVEAPIAVAQEIRDNDDRAVRAIAGLLGERPGEDGQTSTAIEVQERRERDAFAALVASGRPIRKD